MVYGYSSEQLSESGLLKLKEISFKASPAELRMISYFLSTLADSIECGKLTIGNHKHIDQIVADWHKDKHSCDIIVLHPNICSDEPVG